MEDEVLTLAKSLGQIGEKEAQVLGTLCGEACQTLDRRLLPGVRRFSAGDLTIEKDSGGGRALESRAWALMRPYVRDDDFVFRGVRG